MRFDFKNKKVLITGASRGIGRSIAELFLTMGAEVTITGRGKPPDWMKRYKNCRYKKVDFRVKKNFTAFLKDLASWPSLDILINNAGIHIPEPIDGIKDDSWEQIMDVNLNAPMRITREASAKMKRAKSGRILNVSSIAGLVSKPGSDAYSASKSGLIGLTRASALDLAPYNCLVNALCPGHTQTDMIDTVLNAQQKEEFKKNIPMGRFADPSEIARFAVFLCSSFNTYITGQTIVVDGGVTIQ